MEQLFAFMQQQQEMINTLQQQLLAIQTATITVVTVVAVIPTLAPAPITVPILEIASPPKFSGERGQVVGFINAYHLLMQMRIEQVGDRNRISWVLSYVQEEVVEIWKYNILDEITNGTLVVQTMDKLFTKIRQEFGEFDEKSRKVNELRVLEQGRKTIDKYVQEFRRVAKESDYE